MGKDTKPTPRTDHTPSTFLTLYDAIHFKNYTTLNQNIHTKAHNVALYNVFLVTTMLAMLAMQTTFASHNDSPETF